MTATSEDGRDLWRTAPPITIDDLVGTAPFLVLAPHADDETIGCGGLIQAATRRNQSVAIDILTDGSRSHPKSLLYDRARMGALREDEARRAVDCLGLEPDALRFWRVEDSSLEATSGYIDRAVQRLDEVGAKTVLVTWIGDPHCDHKAAFAIAQQAVACHGSVRLLAYPVWSWTCATPRHPLQQAVSKLDIAHDLATKRCALACYASQLGQVVTDDPEGFALSDADIALFTQPSEVFITVAHDAETIL